MQTVTLQEKLYGKSSLKLLEAHLRSLCEGLQVDVNVLELTDRGWIRANISGEDETAASSLFQDRFGFAPIELKKVEMGTVQRGKVLPLRKNSTEVAVDIGVLIPKPVDAIISLQHLQAELVDGKKLSLHDVARLFCLTNNFPVSVLIKRLDNEGNRFVAELSEKQISLFAEWICTNLERLVIIGAFIDGVEQAVQRSGHLRDVAEIETLGLLEHAIVCKLGTYAAGLIPRIGRLLPNAALEVFSPRAVQASAENTR